MREGEHLALGVFERLLGIRKPVCLFYETQLVEDEVIRRGEWRQGGQHKRRATSSTRPTWNW